MANETVTFDLATVLNNIQMDIKQIKDTQSTILIKQTKIEGDINTLETKLEGKIDTLETKLEGKIDTLEIKLEGKIDTLETEMKTGQDGLSKRLDNIEMLIRIIIGGATVALVGGMFTQLKSTLQML